MLPTIAIALALLISCEGSLGQSVVTAAHVVAPKRSRHLTVALYPFIPEFISAAEHIKLKFEAENPDIELTILDLRSNYYASDQDNYIGNVDADVFELDSVLLEDFYNQKKIREMPDQALLPPGELLRNADLGTRIGGKRYGAAHWVCRDFLFYSLADKPAKDIRSLSDLKDFIGPNKSLLMDLKGKSTLGEYYLVAAFDHYHDWAQIYPSKLKNLDPSIEEDVKQLMQLCDTASCRNQIVHELTGIHGAEFSRKRGKALIGYSELLHDVLAETTFLCSNPGDCLADKEIDVADLPIDDGGSTPMTWVDSFTINSRSDDQHVKDAVTFVAMMNRDDTYMMLLLPSALSFLTAPKPAVPVPSYLLPAKSSLYTNPTLTSAAHLYPKLRTLVESSNVPTGADLNDNLRKIGKQIDKDLDKKAP
jgi:thiamine pyridinylase